MWLYLSDNLSVNSLRKLITVSAKGNKNKQDVKAGIIISPATWSFRCSAASALQGSGDLVFWPWFPSRLCGRTTRIPPVWPVCICTSAAPPDTPSDLHSGTGKSCRRFLSPTREKSGKTRQYGSEITTTKTTATLSTHRCRSLLIIPDRPLKEDKGPRKFFKRHLYFHVVSVY